MIKSIKLEHFRNVFLFLVLILFVGGLDTPIRSEERKVNPNLVYLDVAFPTQIGFHYRKYPTDPFRIKEFFEGIPIFLEVGIVNENTIPVTISPEGKDWKENLTIRLIETGDSKKQLTTKDLVPVGEPRRKSLRKTTNQATAAVVRPNVLQTFEAIGSVWKIPSLPAGEYEIKCDYTVRGLTHLTSKEFGTKLDSNASRKKIKVIRAETFEDNLDLLLHQAIYSRRSGDVVKSNEYLEELLKRHPNSMAAYAELAANSLEVGNRLQARRYFEKVVEIGESRRDIYDWIARGKTNLEDWLAGIKQLIESLNQ